MKRDMDLARSILLAIEDAPERELDFPPEIDGFSDQDVAEQLLILQEGGFVECKAIGDKDDLTVAFISITWAGYDFLDSVRDPNTWAKTKSTAAQIGGWTVKLLGEIAKGIIKQKMQDLGVSLG